jgi:ssDNA-binding Zn-finger/Zn-ribbon topoisomerase 1
MSSPAEIETNIRNKNKYQVYKRKRVKCPKCGARLMDENINTSSVLHVMEEGVHWEADYYPKCKVCKAEIGVRKIE